MKKECFVVKITDSRKYLWYVSESKRDAIMYRKKQYEDYREYLELMKQMNKKPSRKRPKLKIYDLKENLDLFEKLKQERAMFEKRFSISKTKIDIDVMMVFGIKLIKKLRASKKLESTQEQGVK